MSSQLPDTDTGGRIWTNPVIRDTICRHTDRGTLLVLLRLSKDSFNAVVPYLWGGRRDDIRLRGEEADGILNAVKNIDRYISYHNAVRILYIEQLGDLGVAPYCTRWPHLRHLVIESDEMYGHIERISWHGGSEGVSADVQLSVISPNDAEPTMRSDRNRSALPITWALRGYVVALMLVHDVEQIEKLRATLRTSSLHVQTLGLRRRSVAQTLLSLRCLLTLGQSLLQRIDTLAVDIDMAHFASPKEQFTALAELVGACCELQIPYDFHLRYANLPATYIPRLLRFLQSLRPRRGKVVFAFAWPSILAVDDLLSSTWAIPSTCQASTLEIHLIVNDQFTDALSIERRLDRAMFAYPWVSHLAQLCLQMAGLHNAHSIGYNGLLMDSAFTGREAMSGVDHDHRSDRIRLVIQKIFNGTIDTTRELYTATARPGWQKTGRVGRNGRDEQ